MNITPLSDRVVIKPQAEENTTASGIIIPNSTKKEMPQIGEIVAIGAGKELSNGSRAKMIVKKGDKVVFSKYAGDDIELDGDNFKILPQDNILAVID